MVSAEVHSVNSRFLDLKLKLPPILNEYESDIRKLVQDAIDRGRVSVTVHVDEPSSRAGSLTVNYDIAGAYITAARELEDRFGITDGLDTRSVMSLPDVVTFRENHGGHEHIRDLTGRVVADALAAHAAMREREGSVIGEDVKNRLAAVRGHIAAIETRSPETVIANTERLREKIGKLIDADRVDENRIATELALYADRIDITEECVRYNAHCDAFEKEIGGKAKTSGKKLSFLLQEMNREANTIASKANDAEISQLAVLIKEEQEKMREQVENME